MASNVVVKAQCVECGGGFRNHRVLRSFEESWGNEDMHGETKHQIVQCQGCDTIRFRVEGWSSEERDLETGELYVSSRIYPELTANARQAVIDDDVYLPLEVSRIYRETIAALNAGTLILAGAGLRAIVEAICNNAQAPGKNLQQKIDGLVTKNLLAKPQADLLHEERYLGNAAIHEVEPPAKRDVETGLAIVESLLNTMYVAPASAERLRTNRAQKAAKQQKGVPITPSALPKKEVKQQKGASTTPPVSPKKN